MLEKQNAQCLEAEDQEKMIDFDDFTIAYTKNSLIYRNKHNKGYKNEIRYMSIDAYKSGHYILKYG